MSQPAWMDHAWANFGVLEARGQANNPKVVAYYADAGQPSVKHDSVPWCAAFVGACLKRAGLKNTGSLMARSYLRWGEPCEEIAWGDVAVFSRGSNPAHGHVGFVVGETASDIFLLGGNQADAVSVRRYPRRRLLGVRRPPSLARTINCPDHAQCGSTQSASADRAAFAAALRHVLKMEGGYTNDPHDPGGPTNQGIILSVFARHRGQTVTSQNRANLIAALKQIDKATVSQIYRDRYWRPSRSAEMPAGVDLMHFDATVNHGKTGAARLLQQAVGVTVDGEIGPITMRAVNAMTPAALIEAYADARTARYRALHHFWRFGRGWLRRVRLTKAAAARRLASAGRGASPAPTQEVANTGVSPMTNGSPGQEQSPSETAQMPLDQPRDFAPATKWWGQSLTIRGAILTLLTTVVPVVAPVFGFDISADMVEQIGAHATALIQAVGGLAGITMTVLGRFRAQERLARTPVQLRI